MASAKIEILFEDHVLLAVNKPAGMPVHATLDKLRPSLQGVLEKQLGRSLVLHHRLDLDTTGVVLFGKDPSINRAMTEMFRDRRADKTYWAVVEGRWLESWTEVRSFIKKVGGRWTSFSQGSGGDPAFTNFKVLLSNGDRTWIEAKPLTGRTHQIRLHCLDQKHPILGDATYGKRDPHGVPMALHARKLEFDHPVSDKRITIEAPLPPTWAEFWLKSLCQGREMPR